MVCSGSYIRGLGGLSFIFALFVIAFSIVFDVSSLRSSFRGQTERSPLCSRTKKYRKKGAAMSAPVGLEANLACLAPARTG